jgi:Wadjet anti plasmid transformation system JetA-like protein
LVFRSTWDTLVKMSGVPALFDRVPASLFGPLAGGHAPLYWSILACLYHLEFEREPLFLVKPVVLDTTEELVRDSALWRERREELLALDDAEEADHGPDVQPTDEAALLRATARRLVARLEASGWFHFEYRSAVGEVLSFFPYAARVIETLVRVARDEQPVFQGYAHSIASLLKAEAFAARPGVSLAEARRHTHDLVRELKILERNIYASTRRLLEEVVTAAGVLQEGLDRYRRAVMANYHRLKTVDNLYKWRGEILHRLDVIERDTRALDAAARWYAEQEGVDRATAADRVAEDLRLLRAQFDALPALIDDIDARNARFSGAALRRLMYFLRHDARTEGQLQLVLDALAHDQAPETMFDVYRCELLAPGFLYTPPRRRPRPTPQPLARRPAADDAALRREVAPRLRRPFSRPRVDAFVDALLGSRDSAPLSAAAPETDQDYVRLIYTVAYGLDGASPYRFKRNPAPPEARVPADPEPAGGGETAPGDDRLERYGIYGFPRGFLARRGRA